MKLNQYIRPDYAAHFTGGLLIPPVVSFIFFLLVSLDVVVILGAWAGWHVARAIAYLKEAYDKQHPERHDSDPMDAEMTIAGASMGFALTVFLLTAAMAFSRLV
jgi:uncharacterized oligopeptide transporter (OPT) family protein